MENSTTNQEKICYDSLSRESEIVQEVVARRHEILSLISRTQDLTTTLFNLNNTYLLAEEAYKNDLSSTKDFKDLADKLEEELMSTVRSF